jgi:NMD protein affecting ribosome stability and mRNA decay
MVFCPICGEDAVDVFCEAHLKEREPLISEITPFTLTACPTTEEIHISGEWYPLTKFERLVKKNLTFNKRAQILEVEFPMPVFEEKPRDFTLPILVHGTVSKNLEPYTEEYELDVPVELSESPKASIAKSGYFEGTLQLRNPREGVINAIEEIMQSTPENHLSRARDVKGGIDFEFTNQEHMVWLTYELRKRFGGIVRKNAKLHTYDHQRSKKVYRLTCLIRLPSFKEEDVIQTKKRLMKVTSMGATVKGWDLERRKYTSAPCPTDDEVEQYEVREAILSSSKPHAMILDPDTYQEVPLAHNINAEPGSTVRVTQAGDSKWYIVDMMAAEHEAIKAKRTAKKK